MDAKEPEVGGAGLAGAVNVAPGRARRAGPPTRLAQSVAAERARRRWSELAPGEAALCARARARAAELAGGGLKVAATEGVGEPGPLGCSRSAGPGVRAALPTWTARSGVCMRVARVEPPTRATRAPRGACARPALATANARQLSGGLRATAVERGCRERRALAPRGLFGIRRQLCSGARALGDVCKRARVCSQSSKRRNYERCAGDGRAWTAKLAERRCVQRVSARAPTSRHEQRGLEKAPCSARLTARLESAVVFGSRNFELGIPDASRHATTLDPRPCRSCVRSSHLEKSRANAPLAPFSVRSSKPVYKFTRIRGAC